MPGAWLPPKGEALVPAAPKGEGVEAPKGEAPAEADPPAEADAAPKGEELRDAPSNGEGALVEALAASCAWDGAAASAEPDKYVLNFCLLSLRSLFDRLPQSPRGCCSISQRCSSKEVSLVTTHAWLSKPKLVSCQSTFRSSSGSTSFASFDAAPAFAEGTGTVAFVNGEAPAGAWGDATALVGALPKGDVDVLALPCAGGAKGEVVP